MAAQRIGGTAFLRVDGAQIPIRGDWTYRANKIKRESIAGQDGVHGYTEMPVVPGMKGKVTDLGGISTQALHALKPAVITLELNNGKVITGIDGWVVGEIESASADGSYDLEWGFMDCIEL